MIGQGRYVLLTIGCAMAAFVSPAAGDNFTLNLHDLAGKPLRSADGRSSVVTVYRQTQEVRVDNRSLAVESEVSKLGRPLNRVPDGGKGQVTFDLRLDGPEGEDRAIIFVVQRFDEVIPTAALQYVIVSLSNSATHRFDIAVPLATYRAPGPPDAPVHPTVCVRKCHKLFHRRCR